MVEELIFDIRQRREVLCSLQHPDQMWAHRHIQTGCGPIGTFMLWV